jgi:hypothetical protein
VIVDRSDNSVSETRLNRAQVARYRYNRKA